MEQRCSRLALFSLVALSVVVAGCGTKHAVKPSITVAAPSSGSYYKDDGPPSSAPGDLDSIPDAEPRDEPLHRFANRAYSVFGVEYTPMTQRAAFSQRGISSWYGRKFHGQKTAIGETYDMFAMSAAHPTAPLPSYARITNARSGKSVIVRINDRGPFLHSRIVDLSYAAAHRIGIAQAGSGEVLLDMLLPPFAALSRAVKPPSIAAAEPQQQQPIPAPTATDQIARMPAPAPLSAGEGAKYFVQLGAFGNFANAQAFQQRMTFELNTAPVVKQVGGLFRVQLGPYGSTIEAQTARDIAQQRLNTSLPIVAEPQK